MENKAAIKRHGERDVAGHDVAWCGVTLVSEDLPKGCGLGTYHDNLAAHLKKKNVDVRLSRTNKLFGNYPISLFSPVKTRVLHFTDQRAAAALFFSFFRGYKTVVTVHDVTELVNFNNVLRIRNLRSRIAYKIWGWVTKTAIKKADAIICVSKNTKKDLLKLIGNHKKVYVTYEAANDDFRQEKLLKNYNDVLYVGSNLAHKNLGRLLDAFVLVKKKLPSSRLVLVGSSLKKDDALAEFARKKGIKESIIFKGYVSDMGKEYSRAALFVFPSLYEGFGLPILEAMACGCPVICSDKTSLPEIAGDAAMYFDGYDVNDLAEKMHKVLTDRNLQEQMRRKGFEQAKKFSWERCAEETIQAYRNLFL